MYIRKKKNKSGSICVQIISKATGKYKVVKTIGSSFDDKEIFEFVLKAKQEIKKIESNQSLFVLENDSLLESYLSEIQNLQIRTIGPELVFGRIFDFIGFNLIN